MSGRDPLSSAIAAALECVRRHQQPDGGFLAYLPGDTTGHATTFTPSLIGAALGSALPKTPIRPIMAPLSRFLRQELSSGLTVNYWPRSSELARKRPYPDDLDDTFCALTALHLADPKGLGPSQFAAIIKLLVAQESSVGGPYRTWVVNRDADAAWQDVDLAVNSNVAYFLSLQEMELPNLTAFAEAAILNRSFVSPYYPSDYPLIYFIARFYRSQYREQLADYLAEKLTLSGTSENPTNTALAITALLRLGRPADAVRPAVQYLLAEQGPKGWDAGPVYIEENGQAIQAPALTAALACEALATYRQALRTAPHPQPIRSRTADSIYTAAVQQVRARFQSLDEDFRRAADRALSDLLRQDSDRQIALLPYIWSEASGSGGSVRPAANLTELGAASLYGWLAYGIYDDFLDQEGNALLLPVANVALRELTDIFSRQVRDERSNFIKQLLDQMESANSWEQANCRCLVTDGHITIVRIPDYGDLGRLAERSLGHALGPISLLLRSGQATDSPAVRSTLEFFRHYLIARQLNDDAHDWEQDLERGQINSVAASLLRSLGGKSYKSTHIANLIKKLRTKLWQNEILGICLLITHHIHLARAALKDNPTLQDTSALAALLTPIEAAVAEAAEGRTSTAAFLEAYHDEAAA